MVIVFVVIVATIIVAVVITAIVSVIPAVVVSGTIVITAVIVAAIIIVVIAAAIATIVVAATVAITIDNAKTAVFINRIDAMLVLQAGGRALQGRGIVFRVGRVVAMSPPPPQAVSRPEKMASASKFLFCIVNSVCSIKLVYSG